MKRPTNSYRQPLVDLSAEVLGEEKPLQQPPEPRPRYHSDECSCESCCDIRASMDIYLQQKAWGNINEWWNS